MSEMVTWSPGWPRRTHGCTSSGSSQSCCESSTISPSLIWKDTACAASTVARAQERDREAHVRRATVCRAATLDARAHAAADDDGHGPARTAHARRTRRATRSLRGRMARHLLVHVHDAFDGRVDHVGDASWRGGDVAQKLSYVLRGGVAGRPILASEERVARHDSRLRLLPPFVKVCMEVQRAGGRREGPRHPVTRRIGHAKEHMDIVVFGVVDGECPVLLSLLDDLVE